MADEGFKRKLTAILSADAVGYSRLMRENEEATVRDIAVHRVLITEIIKQHHGRVIDSPGDNILAEFASVVDAVNGAIKIQEELKRSNKDTPEDRRMEFRIGINLGDVIEEDERIYGDGVNIAARVEGLAAGGGIAISGTVYEHIKEKLSLGYHYLGEQNVKNMSEPVRVYRLLTAPVDAGKMIGERKPKSKKLNWVASGAVALIILVVGAFSIWNYYFRPSFEPASVEKMAYPLPDKPSIAVLPFDNIRLRYEAYRKTVRVKKDRSLSLYVDLSKKAPRKGSLYVETDPSDARVRILNISPAFYQGMELESGRYHLEISASGYEPKTLWVSLDAGKDKRLDIHLKPVLAAVGGRKITNSIGMEFVYISPGSFMMGSPTNEPGRDNDEEQHMVTLTKGYYMQTTEVTVGHWRRFVSTTGYKSEAETQGWSLIWSGKK